MNILVTGAAGFIASHIIEELIKHEQNIIVGIDNFYSGTKENIEYLKLSDVNDKFLFVEADLRDLEKVNQIIKEYQIEQIYHLAAIVSVQESIQNPILSNEVNVKGTLNILEASRLNSVKKIVFSSSAAVYGNEKSLPKDETSIVNPISPYGYEKFMAEQYMQLYSNLYGLETISLRYFNVYGERQSSTSDYSGVISIFEKKFQKDEIPNIYGDGNQYRDFVYVKDVVKANIRAMNTPGISGEVICVGTGIKTSINDIVKVLNKKYNKKIQAKYLNQRDGDIKESVCKNYKLRTVLNIDSFVKFEEGVIYL